MFDNLGTALVQALGCFAVFGFFVYQTLFADSKPKNSKLNFSQKSVLVFGSEGKGIRELVKKECDEIIQIKMKNNLKFEIDSLNVSNATSIALYQFYSS